MKPRVPTAVLVGVWTVAMVGLLPPGTRAQPGGGGGGGGPGGDGGGGPPTANDDAEAVECSQEGSDAHYEEFLA